MKQFLLGRLNIVWSSEMNVTASSFSEMSVKSNILMANYCFSLNMFKGEKLFSALNGN